MSSYTNIFGGTVVQTAQVSYIAITLNLANTVLSWPVQFQDVNTVVSHILDVSPTGGGQTLTLPDATQVSVGQDILVNNPTGTQFALNKNDGTLLSNIAGGNIIYFYLIDNTTVGGTWRAIPFGQGIAAVTSINADVPNLPDSANMMVAGGPITAAGTLHFSFAGDIASLIGFGGGTGIAARTAANTWALRQVTTAANGNLSVMNPRGVAGDVMIDISPNNVGIPPNNPIASMQIGNVRIVDLTVTTQQLNGDLNIIANGTGQIITPNSISITTGSLLRFSNGANNQSISFSGSALTQSIDLTWPARNPADGNVLAFSAPNGLTWTNVPTFFGPASTDMHIARFHGTGGQLQDSPVLLDDAGNIVTNASVTAASSLNTAQLTISSAGGINNISTTVGNISLSPVIGSPVQINSALFIGNNVTRYAILFNSGGFSVSLVSPDGLTANVPLILPPAQGIANSLLLNDGLGNLSFTNTATTGTSGLVADAATTLAAADPTRPVVPLNMKSHPGVAKASVIFQGGDGAILYSYNIAAVNRTGAGNYIVNFTVPFNNANSYVVLVTTEGGVHIPVYLTRMAGSVQINTYLIDGVTTTDPSNVSAVFYGLQ